MDTDELSTETYKGIIIEAGKFNPDLALQFGLMASSCKNEKEYLIKAKNLIKEIQKPIRYVFWIASRQKEITFDS